MSDEQLATLVLDTLEFYTLLVTLIFGAYGFALGRLWPEKSLLPPRSVLWLMPGFAVACVSVVLVVTTYKDLAVAASGQELPAFYRDWLNSYWSFHIYLAASAFFGVAGLVVARKSGGR